MCPTVSQVNHSHLNILLLVDIQNQRGTNALSCVLAGTEEDLDMLQSRVSSAVEVVKGRRAVLGTSVEMLKLVANLDQQNTMRPIHGFDRS